MAYFLRAKKCHKSTFIYILEIVQGETKNNGFLAVYLCTRRPYNSIKRKFEQPVP
jgi:hypothetical protein